MGTVLVGMARLWLCWWPPEEDISLLYCPGCWGREGGRDAEGGGGGGGGAGLTPGAGGGQQPPLFSGSSALSLGPPPPPPPSPSASASSRKPGAGADGREGRGGAGRAGRSSPAGGGGLWQLPLRELVGPFRARGSAPPQRFVPPAPRAQRGGDSSPCTQAAPTGTAPRLASCSDLLGQARRRAFPLWKCFPGGTRCGACMEKKMGEAVARVARKVNETVENGAESLVSGRAPGEDTHHGQKEGSVDMYYRNLADCKLMMFPIGIYKVMRNVTEGIHLITLANNELKSVTSKFITTFSQMRELNLEGNYLRRLPEEMRTLLHLKVINLSRNKFRHFPEQLTTLKALETINLEENEITDVPVEKLSSMESLQSVNLKSNPLNEEVQVIARPLIKFDLLVSPKGAHAAPQA
ncbi:leucine-rich repeat-containing protein 20 isoform X2 [Malaclemys terrapin pileata]|uniref:leucine-rich repeat-containing protein 20 isoform X2 n=1 Tax=Malaclemys terrapin pileata TaxID=2991368 RepID=UPI0023A88AC2|nr:leucine-rich repeat-containing protein 20 isoform X2 [Malaclemys terrapin pileata]